MTISGRRAAPLLALTLALALGACGSDEDNSNEPNEPAAPTSEDDTNAPPGDGADPTTEEPTDDEEETSVPADDDESTETDGGDAGGGVSQEVLEREDVQAAISHRADESGVAPEDVVAVSFEDITWNDGSIGCPEPGMSYTMALVPGHRLVLEVDGEEFDYHAAEDQEFNYCANPSMPGGSPAETS